MNIVKYIQTNTPFIFVKFGDGEYAAANNWRGGNCDGTPYTQTLGNSVIEAVKILSQSSNVYVGKWCGSETVANYFQSLVSNLIQWENYNYFIFRTANEFFTRCLPIYKSIRNAKQQKLYVCNSYMVEGAKQYLNIDSFAVIDPVNWFEVSYTNILTNIKSQVQDPNNLIILTSAGMGAKKLIADLHIQYPNAIILDIGSAMDLICSSRRTRDFHALTDIEIIEIRNVLQN
jgi:hypothetical protein